VSRLKQCIEANDSARFDFLISATFDRGVRPVISDHEALLINSLKVAAKRDFSVYVETFKHVLSLVAADGSKGWKNDL